MGALSSGRDRLLSSGSSRWLRVTGIIAASLAGATLAAAILQGSVGIPDASAVYLLAVVAAGTLGGTWPAVATSVAAFLAYDFLFVSPLYTFNVAVPEEWLHLLLFLVVALVIGRLSALQHERADEAERRAAEARALFAVTRDLALAGSALEAAPLVCGRVAREAECDRVWLALGASLGEERVIADTGWGRPLPPATARWLLHSAAADTQPAWIRIHDPQARHERGMSLDRRPRRDRDADGLPEVYRVPVEVGGETLGSLWATRERGSPAPGRSASRLMAAAADQLGQAVRRDRLAADLTAAEVGRQADALKSALLDSVSHDLRTPLAGIRAAAGDLLDPETTQQPSEVRELAASIDGEALRLGRLVRDLLDMSRIEAGALRPTLEPYELADLVEAVVDRSRPVLGAADVAVDLPPDLPPVLVDAIYTDEILGNLLENAARHAPNGRVRLIGRLLDGGAFVELSVEDDGPGVPEAALERIFDKFYRLGGAEADRTAGRTGMGVGLSVVRGLAEAMGGIATARRSSLGGLALVLRFRVADLALAPSSPPGPNVDAAPDEAVAGPRVLPQGHRS